MAGSAYVRSACACIRGGVRVRHISFISVGSGSGKNGDNDPEGRGDNKDSKDVVGTVM
jgi:hypothetical protein